jgi:hypothetical protein
LRQLQVVCRSAVERAAALRLLTPLQQAGEVVGSLPMAYLTQGDSMLTTCPHVMALTAGADTRNNATRTAATVSCWALVRDMASIQGSASNSLWLMSFECGADTDASEDD